MLRAPNCFFERQNNTPQVWAVAGVVEEEDAARAWAKMTHTKGSLSISVSKSLKQTYDKLGAVASAVDTVIVDVAAVTEDVAPVTVDVA